MRQYIAKLSISDGELGYILSTVSVFLSLGSDGELGYILSHVSVFLSLGSDGELGYILSHVSVFLSLGSDKLRNTETVDNI
jgi:hypothetical protein